MNSTPRSVDASAPRRFSRWTFALAALAALALAAPAQLVAQNTDSEPEIGTPEWTAANIITLQQSGLSVRTGGTGFENLSAALRTAGYAGVEPTLWGVHTGGGTLIKNRLFIGFDAGLHFTGVRSRGPFETYAPIWETPFANVSVSFQVGYNLLHRRSERVRLMPILGVGWGLTRVHIERSADSTAAAPFGAGLVAPTTSVRLRQTYFYAHPQLALQWVLRPQASASLVMEARVGYLIAGDREWNDRYGRLTDAPKDNPSAVTFQLGIGFQLKGKPRNAMSEVMENAQKRRK